MTDLNNSKEKHARRDFLQTSALTAVLPAIFSVLGASPLMAAPAVQRREDIDTFDPSNYIYALSKLAEHKDDPVTPDNYYYFAWIHNTRRPPCEHNSNLFLPWHRALLYFLELALQKVDPPRTANVRIPFYNYTQMPKLPGRYPGVFERPGTILNKMWTTTGWQKSNRNNTAISSPFFSYSEDVAQLIENNPNWTKSNLGTRGSINGFAGGAKPKGGKGAVETPQHDWMHDQGIGGLLQQTTTAAFDPIFWSFHAYIDLIFERWIERYGTRNIEPMGAELNNMPKKILVKDVLDVTKLGYEYPPAPLEKPKSQLSVGVGSMGSFAQQAPLIARNAGEEVGEVYKTYNFTIPAPGFKAAPFVIKNAKILPDDSYHGYLYLHPKSVTFNPEDDLFRERYLADHFSVLSMSSMPGMSMKTDLSFDLFSEMFRIAEQYQGQEWVITVTVVGIGVGPGLKTAEALPDKKDEVLGKSEMLFIE
jgi:tyrosinase